MSWKAPSVLRNECSANAMNSTAVRGSRGSASSSAGVIARCMAAAAARALDSIEQNSAGDRLGTETLTWLAYKVRVTILELRIVYSYNTGVKNSVFVLEMAIWSLF